MPDVKPQALRTGDCTRIFLFGPPGSQKTRTIGTGTKTLILRPPADHTDSIDAGADVQEIVIGDWSRKVEVFEWGQQGGFEKFDWVWLDGVTIFEEFGLDDVFADAVARKPSREEFGADKGEYGINRGRLSTWIRDMVALSKAGKFSFGMTALSMAYWDPKKEEDLLIPQVGDLQGKFSLKMCGYFNMVAYLEEVKRKNRKDQIRLAVDGPGIYGKDQYNCFPELSSGHHGMLNPTIPKIEEAIAEAKKGKPSGSQRKRPARRRRKRTT